MSRTAVVAFGRMSPVTVGHRKLVLKLRELARVHGGDAFLYLSRSYDGRAGRKPKGRLPRNPLKYRDKLRYVQDAFGDLVTVVPEQHRDVFAVLPKLEQQGYTDVILVGDSAFLAAPVEAYNGKDYHFSSIRKVEGGTRTSESSDWVETVSATQVREAVARGDYETFSSMVATRTETEALWRALRYELGFSRKKNCQR